MLHFGPAFLAYSLLVMPVQCLTGLKNINLLFLTILNEYQHNITYYNINYTDAMYKPVNYSVKLILQKIWMKAHESRVKVYII